MFYSQFILAKKGPLGTIWIAAHLERKLRKNQVADTDIGVSVDSILCPEVPIALRLSSHLLLGVVRIYNRKVNYLFDDCSEALLKVKQAFRSTAVDLPPEESKAPYHSITLPETFDLDDFELPDSDIFQGNYVDHHISSREQITLQDSMEGVSYSTSKFGLDERFGDGDASGMDLDEELFLDKIGTSGHAEESADPQTSFRPMSPVKQEEHPEDRPSTSENMVDGDGVDECADLMEYAQAPRTPGLVEEPNLSNVQDASACDDHLESEYNLTESTVIKESAIDIPYEDKQDADWCSQDDKLFDELPQGPHEENGYLEMKESKPEEESPIENADSVSLKESSLVVSEANHRLSGQDEAIKPSSEFSDKEEKTDFVSVDEARDNHQGPDEVLGSVEDTSNQQKSCRDGSELASENQVGSSLETPQIEIEACKETMECGALNHDAHGEEAAKETLFLRPCNSNLEQPDADVQCDSAALATGGGEEMANLGEVHGITGNSEQNLKESQVQEHAAVEDIHVTANEQILKENQVQEHAAVEDMHMAAHEADGQVDNTNSHDKLLENINHSAEFELPAPEKLLSVPEGHLDLHEVSPENFEKFDEGDAGSKTAAGRKRSFTESTLTEQSLNSVESSRQDRFKRTAASVPDDDDLLSSILVGRRSSVLKVKPTPPLSEVTSMKRTRGGPRSSAPKRKVLMDDTMVLHGDMIREQLTSTEDIRRVRKKAPCTLPEISMILKQHLEDEIFHETVFTGTSVELASLHGQVHDLSRISVSKGNTHDASLEIMAEIKHPSQNDDNGVSLETEMEAYLASHDNKYERSNETLAELHLTAPNNESHDREGDKEPGKSKTDVIEESGTDVIEESGPQVNQEELFIVRDNETVGPNDSQTELFLDPDIASACMTEAASLNFIEETDSRVDLDASLVVDDEKTVMPSVELDSANDDGEKTILPSVELDSANVNDEQAIARDEVTEKDDILPGGAQEAAVEVGPESNHENLENNVRSENYDVMYEEQREMECLYPINDGFMNNGENPDLLEAYQSNMMDAEISGLDPHNRDEVNYSAAGNDTEFLNVDDDDLTEMADDYTPDDEETKYTENSGWSSRTRAVSKYLQAAFVKEAENGRKSLSMDILLIGKSRKEASRMFFETLVLKTRDYIHVEQRNPFDDVAIKPRTRLMKSSF